MNDHDKSISVMKALANSVRMDILCQLLKGPSCVNMTTKEMGISQPNLSQHLKVLKNAGLIDYKYERTKHCYYLKCPDLFRGLLSVLKRISEQMNSSSSQ